MRIKLDENMPVSLSAALRHLGHDVETIPEEGLAAAPDAAVWSAAQSEGRFLVTQDLDFSDVRRFAPGSHHGILLVRLRDPDRSALIERVRTLFAQEPVETRRACFVIATEHKLRVRRPGDAPLGG
jgi:predicted nuclease of predicted toxin-antitoxin system